MCGILLIVSKKKLDKKKCLISQKSIETRGPDRILNKYFNNGKIFLSNSILSITGSLKHKKKIAVSKSKNYHIAFNGEIYNWKDLTHRYNLKFVKNDTDLLVNLFDKLNKKQIPKLMNGMFAYCVVNKKTNKIYFSSDVQGEKKLFYYMDNNLFILSSNINAIIKYIGKDKLDYESIKNYMFSRHFIFLDNTIFKNIKILRPGYQATFCIKDFILKKNIYENPLNWISKKIYLNNNLKNKTTLISEFEEELNKQAKLMIPNKKFACILSGGIDSSLQTAIISKIKKPHTISGLNYLHKDKVSNQIKKFEKFLNQKIDKVNLSKDKYLLDLKRSYKIACMPFLTHDFIGRYQISKFFKSLGNKVFFAADGVDELLGGYKIYETLNWNNTKNNSPYSKINLNTKLNKKINRIWKKAFNKYNSFLNKKDSNIQATLFTDYFVNSVYVANIGTDIMCSYNGIEARNIFIQKKIIQKIINLPIRYKINFKRRDKRFYLKYLAKKIFMKYYKKELIFEKQGFSGFPNASRELLKNGKFEYVNKILDLKKIKLNLANEWKILNLEFFLKINSDKINF